MEHQESGKTNDAVSQISKFLNAPEPELHKFFIFLLLFILAVLFIFKEDVDPVLAYVSSLGMALFLAILCVIIGLAKIKSEGHSNTIEQLNETIDQLKAELREKVAEKQMQDERLRTKQSS